MSGFDENPFGEPTVNDPFADPAVRRAAAATPANRGIEDYNPFAEPSSQGATQVRGAANPPLYGGVGATQQPATLQPTSQEVPPPTYARSPQQTVPAVPVNIAATLSPEQQAEAEWKARREEEIRRGSYYAPRNNWPPLPDNCCFQPCFQHDIDVDIHPDFQKIVRQLYYLWMFHSFVLLLNVLGGFILLITYAEFLNLGLGIVYLIIFTPFSFLCWYRPAYNAFKKDSSFNFMIFFFIFFFQLIVTSYQALGFPSSGTCGLIKSLGYFDGTTKGTFVAILLLLIAACYCTAAGGELLLLTKIHRIYRSSTASMSKAQAEFTTTFLRNEHVQNVAGNVAASAVRSQMAGASATAQPRY